MIINATIVSYVLAIAIGHHIYYVCMPTCARRMINLYR